MIVKKLSCKVVLSLSDSILAPEDDKFSSNTKELELSLIDHLGLLTGNSLNYATSDCEISVLGKIYSFITYNFPVTLTSLSAFTVLHAKVDNKIMPKLNAKDASLTLRLNFIVHYFLSRESVLHYGKTG